MCDALGEKPLGKNLPLEDNLLGDFAPFCSPEQVIGSDFPLLQAPAVIVDNEGRVLLWHLPDIIRPVRQVSLI